MAIRRRTHFPGIAVQAVKELLGLQDDLAGEARALREESIGSTTDTKSANYAAHFNEVIRVLPPAGGMAITFPGSTPKTQNKWIEVLKLGGGTCTIVPTSGTVMGAPTFPLTLSGFYYFKNDGTDGWWIQPSSGGGLSPPVALTDLQGVPAATWLGNITGGVAPATANTLAQLRTYIGSFTAALAGLVPASGGGAVNFLRADGAWVAPGGGGGLTLLTTEVNLGSGGVSGSFTIAGAGMTPGRPVVCVQAAGPYTGKGALEDVAEEPVWCTAVVTSAVLITVYWQSSRPVGGNVKFNYAVG